MREELTKINLSNAEYYGYDSQAYQLMEEMAELTQALSKFRRVCKGGQPVKMSHEDAFENIIEEIADVEIMLEQIKFLLKIKEDEIEQYKELKIMRTRKNIEVRKNGSSKT